MYGKEKNKKDPYGSKTNEILLHPVGTVRSELKEPSLRAGKNGLHLQDQMREMKQQLRKIQSMVCELEINPDLDGILDGIEGFSHVLVLYWAHRVAPERRLLRKVHPMGRREIPEKGIFATCSPARPNPVLVTAARLVERCDNVLRVQGLEAVDGSPIIDIKPYNPMYYKMENALVPEWMETVQREMEKTEHL